MYPAPFQYSAPTTIDEAISLLTELGDEGRVLAGGQSLLPMMKLRLAAPGHLVDINGIGGLSDVTANGHLEIGALVRHADVVDNPTVAVASPLMAAAAPWVADPLVRNRGTVCGSIAHCDPEGDWNSVMLALGAEVVAHGPDGERTIPIGDFVVDFFTNSLRAGEMVKAVRVPAADARTGGSYLKLERKIGDYATVGVATHLRLSDDGKIAAAGIGLTSVAPKNLKATQAEAILVGNHPSAELFAEAAAAAAAAADPVSDVRGPADYKRAVVKSYVERGLSVCMNQIQES
ncbi:MAG TPA: xanthine dehydrogenase family protein subunit M [Acidimicrobiia bacterium]|nr:xanthine dehydrogenase family protein subunit M [Acidimicrobiia bacterium]